MTMFLELTQPRRRRMETECHLSALPKIQEFLKSFAADNGWAQAMRNRLDAAVEETLATLFHRGDSGEKQEPRRLQLVAFKENGGAVLELIASSRDEQNLQDRIALLGRYAEGPGVEREISLRLLRHVASFHPSPAVPQHRHCHHPGEGTGAGSRIAAFSSPGLP